MEQLNEQRIAKICAIVLLVVINGLVLINVFVEPYKAGYDYSYHFRYARVLSTGVLPDQKQTQEYFSPPLPYVLPAIAYRLTNSEVVAAKVGQFQNFIASIGVTLLITLFARRLIPDKPLYAPLALVTLGIVPAYYKSFAFFRGEPFLAFFILFAAYVLHKSTGKTREAVLLGVLMGLAVLTRQWAFIAIPGLAIYAIWVARWRLKLLLISAVIMAVLGGWFYLSLTVRFGSPTAYNRQITLIEQPTTYFLGTGSEKLFTNPTRTNFDSQLWPEALSELWGDYWGYWHWQYNHSEEAPAPADATATLARMNIVNLLPTLLVIGLLLFNLRDRRYLILYLVLATTLLGYLAYIVAWHQDEGDEIKAAYMVQLLPFVSLIVGGFLIRHWRIALAIGVLLMIHNSPVFIYNYAQAMPLP